MMKEIFKNNKIYCIFIIIIALIYIVILFKSGIGVVYRYEIPSSSNGLTPDVLQYEHGLLIDNLLIMLVFTFLLATAILFGKNKIVKLVVLLIFIIVSTIFIPIYVSKFSFGKNSITINTDKNNVYTAPIFNIFYLLN